MRVYIERNKIKGDMSNINFNIAMEAFHTMGFHVIEVDHVADLPEIDTASVIVGSINFIHYYLQATGRAFPNSIDYPESLQSYFGRNIWTSTIDEIDGNPANWNVFVKPKGYAKRFTGRLVKSPADLVGTGSQGYNTPVWVSEPVEFVREWRVFVRYGQILDVRPYKGNWRSNYDSEVIENAVQDF